MSKTRKCPNCGARVPEGMRYCGSCGTDLNKGKGAAAGMPREVRNPDDPRPVETAIRPEKTRGARRNMWQYIIVLAIIAVVVAIAVILVIKMNQPAEAPEQSETFETVHVINADGEEIASTTAPQALTEETAAPAETEKPEKEEETEAEPTATPEATEAPKPTETPEAIDVTAASDTVYVTGSGVNLRSGPGTSYDVVAILSVNTALTRTGTTDNNWSRVQYNGKEGFISNAFVTTDKPAKAEEQQTGNGEYTVTAADDTVVVTGAVNVRKGPGTGYDILGVAQTGTELKRTGTVDGWSRVIYNGVEGYAFDGYLKVKGSDELVEMTGTLTVTGDVNMRSGPSTNDSILGLATKGATLSITGKIGNWYRIEYDGVTAYVNGNYVKES